MKLSEFFECHFTPVHLARCKKRTCDLYRQIVNLWIGEVDDLDLEKITPNITIYAPDAASNGYRATFDRLPSG